MLGEIESGMSKVTVASGAIEAFGAPIPLRVSSTRSGATVWYEPGTAGTPAWAGAATLTDRPTASTPAMAVLISVRILMQFSPGVVETVAWRSKYFAPGKGYRPLLEFQLVSVTFPPTTEA